MNSFYKNLLFFLICCIYFSLSKCPELLSERFCQVVEAVQSSNKDKFNKCFNQGDENQWFNKERTQKCDEAYAGKTSLLHLACQQITIDEEIFNSLVGSELRDIPINSEVNERDNNFLIVR
jgi:hypothetical protein